MVWPRGDPRNHCSSSTKAPGMGPSSFFPANNGQQLVPVRRVGKSCPVLRNLFPGSRRCGCTAPCSALLYRSGAAFDPMHREDGRPFAVRRSPTTERTMLLPNYLVNALRAIEPPGPPPMTPGPTRPDAPTPIGPPVTEPDPGPKPSPGPTPGTPSITPREVPDHPGQEPQPAKEHPADPRPQQPMG